jgi:hypothetical protein
MDLIARPIDRWPGEFSPEREYTPFTATWADTVDLLAREVEALGATEIVLQLAITERECRRDGWIRADARPTHPGVIVSFTSRHGPLRYHTDRFTHRRWNGYLPGWQSNVRAIALGLEALRRIDRYGIAGAGQQYTGWNALPAGRPLPAAMTADEAEGILRAAAGPGGDDSQSYLDLYRLAARRHHPDTGGDPAEFRRITEARDLLAGAS